MVNSYYNQEGIIKKLIVVILIFFTYSSLTGQEFTEEDRDKLTELGIAYKRLLQENPDYAYLLRRILENDRKHRTDKTFGIILGGVGLATTVGGIIIIAKKDPVNPLQRRVIGGGMTALGAIEMGFSFSLFSSSKKRKKERDKIIKELTSEKK